MVLYFDDHVFLGIKVSWTHYAGFPAVRLGLARKFAEKNGFGCVLDLLRKPDATWLGAETLSILLKSFCEVNQINEIVVVTIIYGVTNIF